jgi:hypothetical protein
MFDPIGVFEGQFTKVEGGYLFYPSARSGGKLVTAEEQAALLAHWRRVAGKAGIWKCLATVAAAIAAGTVLEDALSFPGWTGSAVTTAAVIGIAAWLIRASSAASRLVRGRPSIAPPRSLSQVGRETRAVLGWPAVIFAIVASGAVFTGTLASPERSWSQWAWLAGSGAVLVSYLWLAVSKFLDRRR